MGGLSQVMLMHASPFTKGKNLALKSLNIKTMGCETHDIADRWVEDIYR